MGKRTKEAYWIMHGKGLTLVDHDLKPFAYRPDYECPLCGARSFPLPYNFCPGCGAKMLNGIDSGKWCDIVDSDEREVRSGD